MNTRFPSFRQTRGALMASALMLTIVAALLISGWVTLMSTRAIQVSYLDDICRRRIGLESSRLLDREYTTNRLFLPDDTVAGNQSTVLGTNIGSINTYDGWTNLNIYAGTAIPGSGLTTVFPNNDTGLRTGISYLTTERLTRPNSGTAGNIDNFNAWHFVKSISPLLSGDIFCIYRKPDGIPTELDIYRDVTTSGTNKGHHALWTVNGRTIIRHPPSLFVASTPSPLKIPFRTRSLYIQSTSTAEPPTSLYPIYGTDSDGADMAPSNMPVVPSTTGPISSTSDRRYQGYLKVINNPDNPSNSLWHFQDREQTAGRTNTITINVAGAFNSPTEAYWIAEQATPTHPPSGWPSGYGTKLKVLFIKLDSIYLKNMRIYGVIDQIVFIGQTTAAAFDAAAALKPVIITVMPSSGTGPWVRDIRFERENARRHVLAFQNNNGNITEFNWVSTPISGVEYRWRCVLINEYQTIMFNLPSTLTRSVRWIGGVMTNWTIKRRSDGGVNASRLTFAPDTDSSVPDTAPAGPAFSTFLPRDAWQETFFVP